MNDWLEKLRWRLQMSYRSSLMPYMGLGHTSNTGLRLEVNSLSDWAIYNDIFVDGEYDAAINAALDRHAGQPLYFLDLGANVGFYTLRIAELLQRKGQKSRPFSITLVEGSPRIFQMLEKRLAAQEFLKGHYKAVNGLAGKREGHAVLHEIAYHGMNSLTPRRFARKVKVPFVNLVKLCRDYPKLSLLKCDIEGAEQLVLENYQELFRKTDLAIFEFHHPQINYQACLRILADCGLTQHQVLTHRGAVSTDLFIRQ